MLEEMLHRSMAKYDGGAELCVHARQFRRQNEIPSSDNVALRS